jgi:hypothetical protein
MNDYRGLSKGLKGRLRIKLCIRNQSVRRRFQAETLPFLGAGPDIMAARSRDCSNSMAPMRGGGDPERIPLPQWRRGRRHHVLRNSCTICGWHRTQGVRRRAFTFEGSNYISNGGLEAAEAAPTPQRWVGGWRKDRGPPPALPRYPSIVAKGNQVNCVGIVTAEYNSPSIQGAADCCKRRKSKS